MNGQPLFTIGDTVRARNAPDQVGRVHQVRWNEGAETYVYNVDFLSGRKGMFERNLIKVTDHTSPDLHAGADAFHTLITYERLVRPPSRVAATFGSARAAFYPYQFKPLLKFLESGTNRVLIADDVGLGKTIEAGYILRELRARSAAVERVLIVVPARLRYKWKEELSRRFDEEFELVRRERFKYLFGKLAAEQEPPAFRWITSYESIRSPDVIAGFREFKVPLDLVIFDEAHKARNPETQQHEIATELAEASDAVVFLTATPVQTGLENLFQLLHILEPATFPNIQAFTDQYEANRPVVRALGALQRTPPDHDSALTELRSLSRHVVTAALTHEPIFRSIEERLRQGATLTRAERVSLQRDIGELSLMGHILSRTRKVDVLINKPLRDPQSVRVEMTAAERKILDELAYKVAKAQESGWGEHMRALMDFRYTASSIPAALRHFQKRAAKRGWDLATELDFETEDRRGWLGSDARPASRRAGGATGGEPNSPEAAGWSYGDYEFPPVDSKWSALEQALDAVWGEDALEGRPYRKVVIFSFFRQTLLYLAERLREKRTNHQLIAGWVRMEDRERRIAEFLEKPQFLVLLSSEVGSEGLDLQRASVIVNYDLPWNPMVVEQRIGRLDRIGQKSPTIKIINLITRDSIEERILEVLYARIQIFRESIGDLEEILGDTVEELIVEALRQGLTAEQQEQRAEQTSTALQHKIADARDLQRSTEDMLAADQAFLDEINALVDERRVPDPRELYRYLRGFYRTRYRGANLPPEVVHGIAEVEFPPEVANHLEEDRSEPDARRVASRVFKGSFPASLEQEAVLDHPRAELLTLRHPLVRLATDRMHADAAKLHRRFSVRMRQSEVLANGVYAFDLRRMEVQGLRARLDLVPFIYDFQNTTVLDGDDARRVLAEMIGTLEDNLRTLDSLGVDIPAARDALTRTADAAHATLDRKEAELDQARATRMRGIREAELNARLKAGESRLRTMRWNSVKPVAIRLQEGQVRAARARLEEFQRTTTPRESGCSVDMAWVADGVLIVG